MRAHVSCELPARSVSCAPCLTTARTENDAWLRPHAGTAGERCVAAVCALVDAARVDGGVLDTLTTDCLGARRSLLNDPKVLKAKSDCVQSLSELKDALDPEKPAEEQGRRLKTLWEARGIWELVPAFYLGPDWPFEITSGSRVQDKKVEFAGALKVQRAVVSFSCACLGLHACD